MTNEEKVTEAARKLAESITQVWRSVRKFSTRSYDREQMMDDTRKAHPGLILAGDIILFHLPHHEEFRLGQVVGFALGQNKEFFIVVLDHQGRKIRERLDRVTIGSVVRRRVVTAVAKDEEAPKESGHDTRADSRAA